MALPYRELHRWPLDTVEGEGFQADGSLVWTFGQTARASDLTPLDDLTAAETDELVDDQRRFIRELLVEITYRGRWSPGQDTEFTILKVTPSG